MDSSVGNFMNLAVLNEHIVAVEMSSGMFPGVQFSSMQFMLSNSKLMFRLETAMDYKNVKTPKDFYHNHIELPHAYTVEDYYNLSTKVGFLEVPQKPLA